MAERPEDLNLPNAVITRIIKEASISLGDRLRTKFSVPYQANSDIFHQLPDGVNISKEARSAISRAASVFVLYATSCANNFAMKGKRKTLNAGDVLSAMEEMEFQRFTGPLKESLEGALNGVTKLILLYFCAEIGIVKIQCDSALLSVPFVLEQVISFTSYRREQKGKRGASELKKKDKDQKEDSEDPDKNREEEEEEERMEEEEPNEEEEEEEEEVDS
ncbi:DNA polymerase epsilon subunit 3 [Varanus komodoensis]|nr:DNA polymerase epsilon subunit 3 [Varanus komodoensis]